MRRPSDGSLPENASRPGSLRSFLETLEPFEVVDAACGGGEFTEVLVEHLAGFHRLVAFDPDKESLDEARLLIDDRRVRFTRSAIEELELPERHYDLVSISNALHHLADARAAVVRLYGLVRPGGVLLLHEMIADGLSPAERNYRDLHHLKAAIDRHSGRVHNETFSHEALRELVLTAAGLGQGGGKGRGNGTADGRANASGRVVFESLEYSSAEEPESVQERFSFIEEYVAFVGEQEARERFAARVAQLRSRVLVDGLQTPRRAVIALRRSPERYE